MAARFEDESRAEWQKPYEVIALLGDIRSKTVMDIGAGTGYFSVKLVEKGANVIAADVDDRFQDYLAQRKAELKLSDQQLELRKVAYDSPELRAGEVHAVVIVNTYHHVEKRVDYFKKVLDGLESGGKLMVVDFQKKEFKKQVPGPPMHMRLDHQQVIAELKDAGYVDITLDESLLEFQYIIIAKKQG
jgi:cyclopropane fatty-acyl-phospholipid synthase-like methyltransferase